jgi:hypothetical protein
VSCLDLEDIEVIVCFGFTAFLLGGPYLFSRKSELLTIYCMYCTFIVYLAERNYVG